MVLLISLLLVICIHVFLKLITWCKAKRLKCFPPCLELGTAILIMSDNFYIEGDGG